MANNWPDGEPPPLSRRDKTIIAFVGFGLVSAPLIVILLFILNMIGPRPSPAMTLAAVAMGAAIGALWVRPWDPRPPRR